MVRWYTNRFKLELSLADKYYVATLVFIAKQSIPTNRIQMMVANNTETVEDVIHRVNRKMDGKVFAEWLELS